MDYIKYKDKNISAEDRAEDLLSRMTAEEKLDQMVLCGFNAVNEYCDMVRAGNMPGIFGTAVAGDYDPAEFNEIQRYAVEQTRLGIPILLASENTHGVCNPYATIYPTTGCLAATFSPDLAYKMASLSGKEAYALGIRHVYAPNVDIPRDPRWGRMEENYGEDPCLSGEMGAAYVKGVQEQQVAATVKHYIGYSVPEGGLNLAPNHLGVRELKNEFLPPFKKCIEAGALSVMPAYNEIDGVPVHASEYWMVDVLRKELGFEGMVITDYGALQMMTEFHRSEEKPLDVAKTALANGIDLEACGSYAYGEDFRKAVLSGEIDMQAVDACVKRILTMKFKLGLFEQPYALENYRDFLETEEEKALALKIAEEGIVLLKNDGVLPLKRNGVKVAVLGPNADSCMLGDYVYYDTGEMAGKKPCVSMRSQSLREALAERIGEENVRYAKGCNVVKKDGALLEEALKVSEDCDVVLLALGSNSSLLGGGVQTVTYQNDVFKETTSGEGYDMCYIELPPCQAELTERIAALGKPTVLLLYGGRPHAVTEQEGKVSAIMQVFGPGEMGSKAICNLLFGDKSPSGKLPFSFPRSTGHIPAHYNHKPSARGSLYRCPGNGETTGRDYVTDTPDALYPFGYGLSYTKFVYEDLEAEIGEGSYGFSVTVKNTGKTDAYETVLLFTSCMYRDVTPEVKKLMRFQKIALKAGETKRVSFRLTNEDFFYCGVRFERALERGKHVAQVGGLFAEFDVKD